MQFVYSKISNRIETITGRWGYCRMHSPLVSTLFFNMKTNVPVQMRAFCPPPSFDFNAKTSLDILLPKNRIAKYQHEMPHPISPSTPYLKLPPHPSLQKPNPSAARLPRKNHTQSSLQGSGRQCNPNPRNMQNRPPTAFPSHHPQTPHLTPQARAQAQTPHHITSNPIHSIPIPILTLCVSSRITHW